MIINLKNYIIVSLVSFILGAILVLVICTKCSSNKSSTIADNQVITNTVTKIDTVFIPRVTKEYIEPNFNYTVQHDTVYIRDTVAVSVSDVVSDWVLTREYRSDLQLPDNSGKVSIHSIVNQNKLVSTNVTGYHVNEITKVLDNHKLNHYLGLNIGIQYPINRSSLSPSIGLEYGIKYDKLGISMNYQYLPKYDQNIIGIGIGYWFR